MTDNLAQTIFKRAEVNFQLGDYYEVINDLNKAIDLEPNNDIFYYKRSLSYTKRSSELRHYNNDHNNRISGRFPPSMDDSRYNYYRNHDKGTFPPYCKAEAISDINKAISLNNKQYKYFNNRGILLAEIEDFNEAIKLNPKISILYFNRAYGHERAGDEETAKADYLKSIELEPKHECSYNNLAMLYESLSDFETARSFFSIAYSINPKMYYFEGNYYNPNDFAPYERLPLVCGQIEL